MKITILIFVMATFCLFFKANGQDNKAIDVTKKGLQIGQQVPDITINNIHNYKTTTAKTSDFKGKLLILDFWATWCSPCVAMIPKMDSLQKQFGDRIQFLSVTYQKKEEVTDFLNKKQKEKSFLLPQITNDKVLHKLFPHVYLPHYVWIDENGTVKAITGMEEVTSANIQKNLRSSSNTTTLNQKRDISVTYNENKPLFINGNGGDGEQLIYHSLLSRYIPGMPSEYRGGWINDGLSFRIKCSNMSPFLLFKYAYSGSLVRMNNRIEIQVKDKTALKGDVSGEAARIWLEKYAYTYELIVPKKLHATMLMVMQEDMKRFFPQYTTVLAKKNMKVLALTRFRKGISIEAKTSEPSYQSSANGFSLKGGVLNTLINNLNAIYLQNLKTPIIDQTGISGPVELQIEANLSDVQSINAALDKYGLKFIETTQPIDILILKDNPHYVQL